MRRVHLIIRGRVQGVCYRMYACEQASHLGVSGWVRNRPDGTVEAVCEGPDQAVAEFAGWCRHGPSFANVADVSEKTEEPTGEFNSFRVTY